MFPNKSSKRIVHDNIDQARAVYLFKCVFLTCSVDHIFEKVKPAMEALGLECSVLGGGKIEHNNTDKKMHVFGESTVSTYCCYQEGCRHSTSVVYTHIVVLCRNFIVKYTSPSKSTLLLL